MIETTVMVPTGTATKTYPGRVDLSAATPTTNVLVLQDTEDFTLGVGTISTGNATIIPSATSVYKGDSFSIDASGFGPNETIDFTVTDKTGEGAGIDAKNTDANGKSTLNTMYIRDDCEPGLATIKAKGRTSWKEGIAQITIMARPEPTAATIVPNVAEIAQGHSFAIDCSGFGPNEVIDFFLRDSTGAGAGADVKTTDSAGKIRLNTMDVRQDAALGTAKVTAIGRTSGNIGTATIKIIASSAATYRYSYSGRRFNRRFY
jgi:hypothetical protein